MVAASSTSAACGQAVVFLRGVPGSFLVLSTVRVVHQMGGKREVCPAPAESVGCLQHGMLTNKMAVWWEGGGLVSACPQWSFAAALRWRGLEVRKWQQLTVLSMYQLCCFWIGELNCWTLTVFGGMCLTSWIFNWTNCYTRKEYQAPVKSAES